MGGGGVPAPGAPQRLGRYPEYRDSGVEWLGEIPAHWEVKRTKFAATLRSGHTPSRQKPEYWKRCNIPWFGLADIWQIRRGQVEYVQETQEKISEIGLANSAARLLPKGTVILSRTASVGFSAILGVDMATTQDFVNWICGPSLRPKYLLYVFRAMGPEFRRLTMGSTHQTIYMHNVASFSTPVPPVPEQDQIVAFVRKEMAKIDALVAKQRELIGLLEEKRPALISHAVTKGLDPDAAMQDSGVEWLGDIPAHWKVAALQYRYEQTLGKMLDTKRITGDHLVPYLRNVDVQWDNINLSDLPSMDIRPHELERFTVRRGDLLVCEGGEAGRCAIWQGELDPCGYQKALHRLRPLDRVRDAPRFLYYTLSAAVTRGAFASRQGTTIGHLTGDMLRVHRFPFPPTSEQHAIAHHLDHATASIDALVARTNDAIALLQEYRTALISAAVTGKVDTRHHTYGQPAIMQVNPSRRPHPE